MRSRAVCVVAAALTVGGAAAAEPPSTPAGAAPPASAAQPSAPLGRGGTMQPTGLFLMTGGSLALALDRVVDAEMSLGGEISLATLNDDMFWRGAYLDAAYSTRSDETRLSVGPELGISFMGLDAGYLLKLGGEHGTQHGFNLRPMLTTGVVTTYFRSAWLLGPHADWSAEVGILLKFPFELD